MNSRPRLRNWSEWYEEKARTGTLSPDTVGYRSARVWAGVHATLRALMPEAQGLYILDVGCGHGIMLAPWASSNVVVGVDVTWSMLPLARGVGLRVVQGDGRALPFRPASFDAVVSVEMLQHLEDVDGFVAELAGLVRPGGSVIVGTANSASVVRRLADGAMRVGLLSRPEPAQFAPPRARPLGAVIAAGVRAGLLAEHLGVSYFPLALGRRVARVGRIHALLVSNFIVAFRRPGGSREAHK
jgi:2-polyprenyl-3-methyl-5-hydroxy-6-metoxy-1,4-benzoquinol methylase